MNLDYVPIVNAVVSVFLGSIVFAGTVMQGLLAPNAAAVGGILTFVICYGLMTVISMLLEGL